MEVGPGVSALFVTDSANRVTRMDWTQGGRTARYTKSREAARVEVSVLAGRRSISMSGGGGARYDIEASSDLRSWRSIGTVATEADRVEDSAGGDGDGPRFYRAARRRE